MVVKSDKIHLLHEMYQRCIKSNKKRATRDESQVALMASFFAARQRVLGYSIAQSIDARKQHQEELQHTTPDINRSRTRAP